MAVVDVFDLSSRQAHSGLVVVASQPSRKVCLKDTSISDLTTSRVRICSDFVVLMRVR